MASNKDTENLIFSIATHAAPCMKAKKWIQNSMSWLDLVTRLEQIHRTDETVKEFHNEKDAAIKSSIKDVGGFVGGKLEGGKRTRESVISRSLLTLDLDNIKVETNEVIDMYSLMINSEAVFYSTHSHTPQGPRLRLVIPLDREVTPDEYQAISRLVAKDVGMGYFDKVSFAVNQLMFWPSTPKDGTYFFKHYEGAILNVDEYLGRYHNWKDVSEWPRHPELEKELRDQGTKQMDPLEKDGDIGRFNNSYAIQEAIDTFLFEIYEATDDPNIYTFRNGSTFGGAKVYDDKFLYSYHSTDPAGDHLCSSFDLVRLHLYGHLDEKIRKDFNPEELPSFKKMLEHARTDPKVTTLAIMDEFGIDNESENDSDDAIEIITEKANELGKFLERTKSGQISVNTALLAEYFKAKEKYLIVRKQGFDNDILYFYENGSYRRISSNELKGRIKEFIPIKIRKPYQWEEVYKNLITETTATKFEDLDKDTRYINFKNGLLNVKTMELEDHRPEILSTFQLNYLYNVNASRPSKWIENIERLTNEDESLHMMIQEWIGLTISSIPGYYTKKCLVLYSSLGDTGKTQVIRMINHLIGSDFVSSIPIQDLSKPFGTSSLYGARAIVIDDQKSSNFEDSSTWKSLTGGGAVDVEFKGKQSFTYRFNGTISFATNDLPYIKDDKGGHSFGRMAIIPCTNIIPKEERIGNIFNDFTKETEGIILWALEGLQRLIQNGYTLTESAASIEALKEYRENNDSMYKWLNECVEITKDSRDKIPKRDFEETYRQWCVENEYGYLHYKNISKRAEKHGIQIRKQSNNYYLGVRFKIIP